MKIHNKEQNEVPNFSIKCNIANKSLGPESKHLRANSSQGKFHQMTSYEFSKTNFPLGLQKDTISYVRSAGSTALEQSSPKQS